MGSLIREACESDFQRIVFINELEVQHTSPMDVAHLNELHGYASYHKVVDVDGIVAGFLLAMRGGCEYRNDNYDWFVSRYAHFFYIDRVVINSEYAGKGLASLLYKDLFDFARKSDVPVIGCEINSIPPNKASALFHQKLGFEEVGTQWLIQGEKQVSMQLASL